jgi:hypothetical protein
MPMSKVHCKVIETVCDQTAGRDSFVPAERELSPWADPFIARLVARYRLRAALDDSLRFLQTDASYAECQPTQLPEARRPRGSRFTTTIDDCPPSVDSWPW